MFLGLMKPRLNGISGNPLPFARIISTNIHNDVSAPHVRYTLMMMQFGQFLDHDLTFTPINKGKFKLLDMISLLMRFINFRILFRDGCKAKLITTTIKAMNFYWCSLRKRNPQPFV